MEERSYRYTFEQLFLDSEPESESESGSESGSELESVKCKGSVWGMESVEIMPNTSGETQIGRDPDRDIAVGEMPVVDWQRSVQQPRASRNLAVSLQALVEVTSARREFDGVLVGTTEGLLVHSASADPEAAAGGAGGQGMMRGSVCLKSAYNFYQDSVKAVRRERPGVGASVTNNAEEDLRDGASDLELKSNSSQLMPSPAPNDDAIRASIARQDSDADADADAEVAAHVHTRDTKAVQGQLGSASPQIQLEEPLTSGECDESALDSGGGAGQLLQRYLSEGVEEGLMQHLAPVQQERRRG